MSLAYSAGRIGSGVKSDCRVTIEPRDSGGIELVVKSKVQALFGIAIRKQALEVIQHLGVANAMVLVEDAGALPFTISARIETAVRRAGLSNVEYLPEFKSFCQYPTSDSRFRRSRIYLPGNDPKYMLNIGLHQPDSIILDLEDSVSPLEKDAARVLVRNGLRQVNFYGCERMVRINQGEMGLEDLKWILPHNVHVILIPKVETPEEVIAVDEMVVKFSRENNITAPVFLMPIIESAMGGLNALAIAKASPNNVGLAIGLEDYTADLGVQRTLVGTESFWLRSVVVNAARAAGIQPIDTVFSDVADSEGLRNSVVEAKGLGFDGKGCIHPRQIKIIHEAFAPTVLEIDKARKIVIAFEQAEKQGLGVVSLGSKMIDPPVVKRALQTVGMAESLNILSSNWREETA